MSDDTIMVACPSCHGLNRVPLARLGDAPVCGSCRALLFAGQPVDLDEAAFERHVLRSELPVLVDFWAPWCQPCLSMAPQFKAATARMEPAVRAAKVDTDAQPTLAGRYNIRSLPTLVLFHGGSEVARHSGAVGAADILRWTAEQLTD